MGQSNEELIINLQKMALDQGCYLTWVGIGGGLGALSTRHPIGVLAGVIGGLLWASRTCKPISEAHNDFLSAADFERYHEALNQHVAVSREQAMLLAIFALRTPLSQPMASPHAAPPGWNADIERIVSAITPS